MSENTEAYPNVLVISNNCFSKSGSNGRTLSSLFSEWEKKNLSQFYISNETPDFDTCSNYYRITDVDVIKGFFYNKKDGRVSHIREKEMSGNSKSAMFSIKNKIKSTAFGYITRNFIWRFSRWENKYFREWISTFNPDLVLIQAADYEFMFKIALSIGKTYNIPIVIYNSEDYYVKNTKERSVLYRLYFHMYKKTFRRLMNYASTVIYSNEMLEKTFSELFDTKSITLHTPTSVKPILIKSQNKSPVISYLGNLGLGRHLSLIEISETLREIDNNLKLNIYGKLPNNDVKKAFDSAKGIKYQGFINYTEVLNIMSKSDILVHVENFSEYYRNDLKHAFSTKISDSLAIGVPLFVYAPNNLAITRYLIEKDAACVATSKDELKTKLENLIYDDSLKDKYLINAKSTLCMDFNTNKICSNLLNVIKRAISEKRNCK